jgi:FkbM family methyltransferase
MISLSADSPNANTLTQTEFMKSHVSYDAQALTDTITIEEIMSRYDIERIDVLKLDCVGCESSVLPGIKKETFNRIGEIVIVSIGDSSSIEEVLRSNDFDVSVKRDGVASILVASH